MEAEMTRHEAHAMLASLRPGDAVRLTRDGRTNDVTVQRSIRGMDGGGFGSWDYSSATVGYGPGRWNMEVNAAGIAAGSYVVEVAS
jgi:hypothetical protein